MTIYPMEEEKNYRPMINAVMVFIALGVLIWGVPVFFNTVMDRLENQKEARAKYMYKTYGDLYN